MTLSGKAFKVVVLAATVVVTVSGTSRQYYYPPTSPVQYPSPNPSDSRSPRPSVSRSPRPSVSRSPRPSVSRSSRPSASRSPRPSPSRSPRPSPSRSPRPSPTRSPTPSTSRSPTPSTSRSPSPSSSKTPRPSLSRSPRPSVSRSPRPSNSRSPIPSPSSSSSRSARPSQSRSPAPSFSSSPSGSVTPSQSESLPPSPSQEAQAKPTTRSEPYPTDTQDVESSKCGCKPFCASCSRNTDCQTNICMNGRCGSTTATQVISCSSKARPLCATCNKNEDCASDNCVQDRCVTPLNKDRKMDPLWEDKRIRMEKSQSQSCAKRRLVSRCGGCGNDNECKDEKCQFGFCAKESKDFLLCAHQFESTLKSKVPWADRESVVINSAKENIGLNGLGSELGNDEDMTNVHEGDDEVYWDDGQEGGEFNDANLKWNNDEGDMEFDQEQKMQNTKRSVRNDVSTRGDSDTNSDYTVEGASCPRVDGQSAEEGAANINVEGSSYVQSEGEVQDMELENSVRVRKGEVGDAAWDLVRSEVEAEEGELSEGDGSEDTENDDQKTWNTAREAVEEKDGKGEGYDVHGDQVDVGEEEDLVLDDAAARDDVQVKGMVSIGRLDEDEVEGRFVDDVEEDEILKQAMRDAMRG